MNSFSELHFPIIHPKYDTTLGGLKYSIGDYRILYPPVDPNQAINLVTKHICALESPIQFNPNDGANICEQRVVLYSSNLQFFSSLENLQKTL